MRKIKLIWDFKGPTALGTAKHHCIHLKEYAVLENIQYYEINHAIENEYWAMAYMIVDETIMIQLRDALKPHRGEVA